MTKVFVTTNTFVATKVRSKVLSRQAYFYCDKRRVCRDKSKLVVTKLLSRQNYVCCDKCLSRQKFCHDKNMFVATSILLSRQKMCFVVLCRDNILSLQKLYWVAAPANDKLNADSKLIGHNSSVSFVLHPGRVCGLGCIPVNAAISLCILASTIGCVVLGGNYTDWSV